MEKGIIPNYPLDTAQLNYWLTQSHDILDSELIRAIDWQRYQLDHISSKFIAVNQSIVSGAGFSSNADYTKALVKSLGEHIEKVLKDLPHLVGKIPADPPPVLS